MTKYTYLPYTSTYSSTHHNTNRKHNISVCEEENVKLIAVELPGVVVHSIYKPPPEPFRLPALGQRNKPHIVIGDFNSTVHSGHTPQQTATENLWSNGRTQTACRSYTTRNYRNHSTMQYGRGDTTWISSLYLLRFRICHLCEKSVLDRIPRTQHRPICATVNPVIVPLPTTSSRRFNLIKEQAGFRPGKSCTS